MAVLLMLMYVRRGVLRPQQVAPVYTFGAPGIFCDGALGACSACLVDPSTGAEACSLVRRGPLLSAGRRFITQAVVPNRPEIVPAVACARAARHPSLALAFVQTYPLTCLRASAAVSAVLLLFAAHRAHLCWHSWAWARTRSAAS
jgi:hypothetical protein